MMDFRAIHSKCREKHRRGLVALWVFERLAWALGRAGLTIHLSVVYREGIVPVEVPKANLPDISLELASEETLADIALVEGYTIPPEMLRERFAQGAGCCLLRNGGQIVALCWYERGGAIRPRLALALGASNAYLFDAFTAPSYRGRNLLPFLRYRLYTELRRLGCTGFFSSTVAFNRPAHRFKLKLGARPQEVRLYLRLFGRLERVFIIWRFASML
jgi:GNAT superfamily N-acetyltransferase